MRETKFFRQRTPKYRVFTAILLTILMSAFAMAESGTINLSFENAQVIQNNDASFFEFDVKGYVSEGSDVVGEGMVYVQYPVDVFGEVMVYNQKVTVTKTGVLAEKEPFLNSDLYRIVNITDTYSDVFAITFGLNYDQPDMKPYYSLLSSDAENPSDLFHLSMEITHHHSGTVQYPSFIPGLNFLYYDFEGELFTGGLNITDAQGTLENGSSDPGTDPAFAGNVNVIKFAARYKRSTIELNWRSTDEADLSDYIIERSQNGVDFEEAAIVSYKTANGKFNSYVVEDLSVEFGTQYTYQLYACDMNGTKQLLATTDVSSSLNKKAILDDETFTLEASYPNPFNPSFTVPFTVHTSQNVDIKLYDLNGKLVQTVADGYYSPGNYEIRVSCDHLVSGVYLLRTQVNEQQAIQKMLLTK